jgi:hypothetical protein
MKIVCPEARELMLLCCAGAWFCTEMGAERRCPMKAILKWIVKAAIYSSPKNP